VSPDPERCPAAAAEEAHRGLDQVLGFGPVLCDDHAAHVILDWPRPGDQQLAGEIVAGDGSEGGGEQLSAAVRLGAVWALRGRREERILAPGDMRAGRCCVVAWCWSACGLLARPARRSLEAAEEGVQAGGEPFVAVVCPDVLAEGGQRREPAGWQ
jgi:hypothetical protein